MDKEDMFYIYMCVYICFVYIYTHTHVSPTHTVECYSAMEKRKIPTCSSTNGPGGYYAKWNMSDEKDQCCMTVSYVWNPKSKANDQTKQKRYIDTENKLVVAGVGVQGWLKKACGQEV